MTIHVEPERGVPFGREVIVRGSIFKDNAVDFSNLGPEVNLEISESRVAPEWHSFGPGNIASDPLFLDEESGDYRLAQGSPCVKAGPNELDMGAFISPGTHILGVPVGATGLDALTLFVGGPGIYSYRYALDDEPFGEEISINTPISLETLANGVHSVRIIGKNSAGVWQKESAAFRSHEWTLDMSVIGGSP